MLHVSFAMTSGAFTDRSKTETRRFWKPRHAEKFRPGVVFMGITKDFRADGKRMHPARVIFCRKESLGDMTEDSFLRDGGTRYWPDRMAYIAAMGGPHRVPYVIRFEHLTLPSFQDQIVDEFVIPLANMALDGSNKSNIYDLCDKAKAFMEKNAEGAP
ncbi:MAG: hypothetical protein JRF53_00690 [Deltaproteobacteria bacterium]|nr:hypothetical protein [Deltaproteobacteria bacterium]